MARQIVIEEQMAADDVRAKQGSAFAARLDRHGTGPYRRPTIIEQRAREAFDSSLLKPQQIWRKLSAEELFDPVDHANCAQRITAEGEEVVLHSDRRDVQHLLPDSHELHFHGIARSDALLRSRLELGRDRGQRYPVHFAVRHQR